MLTNNFDADTGARLEENIDWIVENVDSYHGSMEEIFVVGYNQLLAMENIPFYQFMAAKCKNEWKD